MQESDLRSHCGAARRASRWRRIQGLQRHPIQRLIVSPGVIHLNPDPVHRSLTKLPIMAGAPRASNEGTRFETDATNATPQNAPTSDQKAIRIFPTGLGDSSR